MYRVLKTLREKRVTPTREMTLVLAQCLNCLSESTLTKQNFVRANREKRAHCPGCLPGTFHKMSGTRPYRIWRGVVARVGKPPTKSFEHYGGRGVGCDPRWLDFNEFWLDMRHGYSDGLTIERKDVNGDYCKENCIWVTNLAQQSNKRNNRVVQFSGEEMHLAEFCRKAGVTRGAITRYLDCFETGDAALAAYLASAYPRGRRSRSST